MIIQYSEETTFLTYYQKWNSRKIIFSLRAYTGTLPHTVVYNKKFCIHNLFSLFYEVAL